MKSNNWALGNGTTDVKMLFITDLLSMSVVGLHLNPKEAEAAAVCMRLLMSTEKYTTILSTS